MRGFQAGCVIVSMALVACGSGLGSVQGHDVSTSQAIFLSFGPGNTLLLVTGDMGNLCDVFTGKGRPAGSSFTVLETLLANWNGTSSDPAVPGTYVQSVTPTADSGLFSDTLLQWGSGCAAYSALQASSGTVRVESFGGSQAGAHLVTDVDLRFGDDHLAGRVDAVYCGQSQQICGP